MNTNPNESEKAASVLEKQAVAAEKSHEYEDASDLFFAAAHERKDVKEYPEAARLFMRSAIARERCDPRRRPAYIWVKCGESLENRNLGPILDTTDGAQAVDHFFPTMDWYAWGNYSREEKIGTAYKNAGYHLLSAGSLFFAHEFFMKAGNAFRKADRLPDASRAYYRALLCYINHKGDVDLDCFEVLEKVDRAIVKNDVVYLTRQQIHWRGIAAALIAQGNYSKAADFAAKENEATRKLARAEHKQFRWSAYTIWKYTSYYGNSLSRWTLVAMALFLVGFPILFRYAHILNWTVPTPQVPEEWVRPTWLDWVFFSTSTITTAADPSFNPTLIGKLVVMIEQLLGFLMLGSLLTLLVKKVFR